jgi:hypothetical protein
MIVIHGSSQTMVPPYNCIAHDEVKHKYLPTQGHGLNVLSVDFSQSAQMRADLRREKHVKEGTLLNLYLARHRREQAVPPLHVHDGVFQQALHPMAGMQRPVLFVRMTIHEMRCSRTASRQRQWRTGSPGPPCA